MPVKNSMVSMHTSDPASRADLNMPDKKFKTARWEISDHFREHLKIGNPQDRNAIGFLQDNAIALPRS
jgi:hypothetical protein